MVTNVSPEAGEKKLTDFFTFCGRVESLSLVRHDEICLSSFSLLSLTSNSSSSHLTDATDPAPKTAVIIFATEDAAQTALLLTNAHVVDRAIKVSLLSDLDPATAALFGVSAATDANTISGDQIQQKNFPVPDQERVRTIRLLPSPFVAL